jgi:O-succinylbenzoic acid--CoA ligase
VAGATLVSLVPTALLRVDPGLYRVIVLGGSRPPSPRPSNCIATYGMTETGSGVIYDGIPLDGVETKVVDGIIHLRCPMLMRCYRDGSSTIDNEGWLRTGDMGSLNDDGTLRVDGREGDLIITGGENVWPEPVEAAIDTHPAVTESCVVGVDDPEWGQAVHAFVVVRGDLTLEALREHVKETLPAHCAPKHLHVVETIPRTALGKPMRRALAGSVG